MDKSQFTSDAPGQLRRIEVPGRDWAFVPAELPVDWEFPGELWPLLAEAKEALGTLNGIGQTLPNAQLLLRPLLSREAISSSSIEGTYVTPQQLLLYELDPAEPARGDTRAADSAEVRNYGLALQHGRNLLAELPIGNRLIREMHRILMQGVRGQNKAPGEFRRWQVQLGISGRFIPPPAGEIADLMGNFEKYANTDDERYDPLVKSFMLHYQFETIHPFGDGNGRVGRSLLALMIYAWLGHSLPWLYMSAYFERYRDEYVDRMFRVSTTGAWGDWIEFCLHGAVAQAKDSIRRCNRLHDLRAELHQRIAKPSPRTYQIIESLFASPVATIPSVAQQFGTHYQTAQADVEKLVKAGVLEEMSDSRPRSFCAPDILRIAFGEGELA